MVGKTREDVLQELRDARANGTLIANSETGETYRDIDPRSYPAADVAQGKTRAQVLAELAEARRTGDLIANSETGCASYRDGCYPCIYTCGKWSVNINNCISDGNVTGTIFTSLAQ